MYNWKCPYCQSGGEQQMSEMANFMLMGHLIDVHLDQAFGDLVNNFAPHNKAAVLKGHSALFSTAYVTNNANVQQGGFFSSETNSVAPQEGQGPTNEQTHGVPPQNIVSNPDNEKPSGRKGRSANRQARVEAVKAGKNVPRN